MERASLNKKEKEGRYRWGKFPEEYVEEIKYRKKKCIVRGSLICRMIFLGGAGEIIRKKTLGEDS